MLVNIEGFSGSGKSTLSKLIEKELNQSMTVAKTFGGFEIRNDSSEISILCNSLVSKESFFGLSFLPETFLLYSEILSEVEILLKSSAAIKIFDNYWDSIFITQKNIKSAISPIERKILEFIHLECRELVPKPDILIFVKTDFDKCLDRIRHRDGNQETTLEMRNQLFSIYKEYEIFFMKEADYVVENNDKPTDLNVIVSEICETIMSET